MTSQKDIVQTIERGTSLNMDKPADEVGVALATPSADDAGREACVLLYGTTDGVKTTPELVAAAVNVLVTDGE